MRLVGILPALLSAATLLQAVAPRIETFLVPKHVNFRIQVFPGTNFKALPNYRQMIKDVFDEAHQMFLLFTDSYSTTFTLTPLFSVWWDDSSISFDDLKRRSGLSDIENINLFAYFASNKDYRGQFRKSGMTGKVCDADKGFMTLLLNQYDRGGRKQGVTVWAKMVVYYLASLLGMRLDRGTCPRGLMSSSNWRQRTWKKTWNICNVQDLDKSQVKLRRILRTFAFKCPMSLLQGQRKKVGLRFYRYNGARWVPGIPTLTITLASFTNHYDFDSKNEIRRIAEEFLNRGPYSLGVKFELKHIESVLPNNDFKADNLNIANTLETAKGFVDAYPKKEQTKFFLYFTDQGLHDLPQQAHPDMNNKFCHADTKYRTFIFDQKDWGGKGGQFSIDGVAKQLAYFIASSLGLRLDEGSESCPNGFMQAKGLGSVLTRKEFIAFWNRKSDGLTWNRCNIEDMTSAIEKKNCLKKSLVWKK